MLKQKLYQGLRNSLLKLNLAWEGLSLTTPPKPEMGDFTTNISLILSKATKSDSMDLAHQICDQLTDLDYIAMAEVVEPGFINFYLKPEVLAGDLKEILENPDFSKNNSLKSQKIQVEFISANPTGPLTLANGRGGAIGDTIANILIHSGASVEREYYVNDAGNQIRLLADSVKAAVGLIEPADNHYQGEYIKDLAKEFKATLNLDPQELGAILADYLLSHDIKPAIERLGVKFDGFFSERSLYPNKINHTLDLLKDSDLAYEKDDAWWFKSSQFGDDKDRVLMTSTASRGKEEPTYFLADIAHHLSVYEQGTSKRVLIIGADHHSYFQRLDKVLRAIFKQDKLDVVLMQLVRLFKAGKEVKMSKRAGTYVTLNELLDSVPSDAVRFFFLLNAETTHLDFDLNLAKEQSNKNPVYYVQYAHARMSNILAKAPRLSRSPQLELLTQEAETRLIKHLLELPQLVLDLAGKDPSKKYKVHHLTAYARNLADLFHKFYEQYPVLQAGSPSLTQARLSLVKASQITLATTLNLMGISAPEKM